MLLPLLLLLLLLIMTLAFRVTLLILGESAGRSDETSGAEVAGRASSSSRKGSCEKQEIRVSPEAFAGPERGEGGEGG